MIEPELVERAARAIAAADALVIGAGAGMGVDSGLPDFRGTQGFWEAYPPYQRLGLNFMALANPRNFASDPTLAWGFYGHRMNLYRATPPHAGFATLRRWAQRCKHGAFIFTSNVDGHFQKAGFDPDRIVEVHGSIEWMQCTGDCGAGIYPATDVRVEVDEGTMRAQEPLPHCPCCGNLARPNILMFGDWGWDESRTTAQQTRLEAWLERASAGRIAVIECGAGTAIPTVRIFCERLAAASGGSLIRINPREPSVPPGQVSITASALTAIRAIDEKMTVR